MAFLMLLPSFALADGEKNLLVNPSFEELDEHGMPVGWFTDAFVKREGVTLFSVNESASEGNRAVVVENLDMNDARFAQTAPVEPNKMYCLSGWILATDILDAGRGANLSVEGVYAFSDSLYDTAGEWQYIETYGFTGNDQTEITIFARVGGYSGESQGKAAFDDLALFEVDALPDGVQADAWYTIQTVQAAERPAAEEGGASAPFWPWLIVLASGYAAVGIFLLKDLQKDRRELALKEVSFAKHIPAFAVVGICAAFAARLLIALRVEGYQVDVNCFTAWGNTMASVGPAMFYQSNWCDYTPGYIYAMGLNGLIANLLSRMVSPAFVHKLIPMICDVVGAMLLYHLAVKRHSTRYQAGLLAILFAFNPAAMINSAAWCQIDSVLCIGLMFVAHFAIQRKWMIVMPLYVLCILIKPQALMLGFLGLSAMLMELFKKPVRLAEMKNWASQEGKKLREMAIGLLISLVLALAIILPFCPNQESPWWLFQKYAETLASYPYATVNTANIFYLFHANWNGIENPASAGVCIFFMAVSAGWCAYTFLRQKNQLKNWGIEPALMAAYSVVYLALAIIGCNWTVLGVATMSMAFVVVLPMFIRSGKQENLPLCGAVIFLLLYVFGIKMHERYLFPAIFLLGMAYAIRRDRRILALLIGSSCVLFINEGIVLDNSIRLGASMGHLNPENAALANCLSVLNISFALFSVWLCYRVCVEKEPLRLDANEKCVQKAPAQAGISRTPLSYHPDAGLGLNRRDALLMLIVTVVYSIVTLTTLGSTKAPQKPWKSSTYDEAVIIDLGKHYDDFSMLYFCQVSYSNFAVSVSGDIDNDGWSKEYPAQMAEGQCFQWKYLTPSYQSNGNPQFVGASTFADVQKLSGRFVRIDPKQVGLVINEVIFKDANGEQITGVSILGRENGNADSPLYSNPEHLLDEQNTLEGEPSWWNSTYFDEIYHARTAFEHLNQTYAYEWTHPPLGKIIMSWFIGIFGMTPFGWRFAGALCGILMLPAMYLLAKQLTKRTDMAFLAMMLMALDCMHFTQTRLATIDSYPVLFIMLSYFFMLRFMQRDIVLEDVKKLLPDLAMSGFFMGCGVASKWIGVYAGVGLGVLYFWMCLRHFRLSALAMHMQTDGNVYTADERNILEIRAKKTLKRIALLCTWCLLFFVAVPVILYLLSYTVHFADRNFSSMGDFLKTVYNTNFGKTNSMLSYHSTPGLGMDHSFYSHWYEWPLMMTPMYYASAAFKPEGMTFAIFCFGNPWVWSVGLVGVAYALYRWAKGHFYRVDGVESSIQLLRNDWDVAPGFILIGLLAQFLPWVLVPRGTYIYHYFASIPFLIIAATLMFHRLTLRHPKTGRRIGIGLLILCLIWFIILFPYASGLPAPNAWMDFIRDYPYLSLLDDYWQSDWLVVLNSFFERIPIFPHVYHH